MPKKREKVSKPKKEIVDQNEAKVNRIGITFAISALVIFIGVIISNFDFRSLFKTEEILDSSVVSDQVFQKAIKALQNPKNSVNLVTSIIDVGKMINQTIYHEKVLSLLKSTQFVEKAWSAINLISNDCYLADNSLKASTILYILHDAAIIGANIDVEPQVISKVLQNCEKLEDPPNVLLKTIDIIAKNKKVPSSIIPSLMKYSDSLGFGPWTKTIASIMSNIDVDSSNEAYFTSFLDFSSKSRESWGKDFQKYYCKLVGHSKYTKSGDICTDNQ